MDTVKFVPMLVGLLLAVVMVGAVFVPVISSSTTRTVTTEIENEGAGWLALGYNEGTDYSFTVGFDGEDNFSVGTQTGEYDNMICYADPQRTLFVSGDYWYLLTNGENPTVHKFTDTASVTNASGTLTITDGEITVYTGASPTWAYVPDANGNYGFFTEGGLDLAEGKPKVAVGSYAGVFVYNDTVVAPNGYGDLGLTMSGDYAEGEVIWEIPSELNTLSALPTDTFEPAVLDLDPISIQPIDLGGSGSVGLMAVAPGDYTDDTTNLWTFGLSNNKAYIVSYLGSDTDELIIPTQVTSNGNTYPVYAISVNRVILENNQINPGCKLVIPEGVTNIYRNAFQSITNLGSPLVLPHSLTSIGQNAFMDVNLTGALIIPENVNTIELQAFQNVNGGLDSVIILGNITNGASSSFRGQSNAEVLNLSGSALPNMGLDANKTKTSIDAIGYIAPVSINETEVVPIDSPVASLMQLLPLIAGIGALFVAVGTMIYTRF